MLWTGRCWKCKSLRRCWLWSERIKKLWGWCNRQKRGSLRWILCPGCQGTKSWWCLLLIQERFVMGCYMLKLEPHQLCWGFEMLWSWRKWSLLWRQWLLARRLRVWRLLCQGWLLLLTMLSILCRWSSLLWNTAKNRPSWHYHLWYHQPRFHFHRRLNRNFWLLWNQKLSLQYWSPRWLKEV